ncbi:hypothetical protein TraAM80_02708 [Trypanosoma rangeli]|uniref:Uncharacterized protein n=1 Tax=Trypanosoma rangeli TaxID=5698 RepID=A0A422NSP7_TRYRA|nr:uncharacterized protein TraAM80_02708 [Trypanosoma rangeli]RNF08483.1 hypothetical protein TraAM80_02708 [Trypanosoma rangeli]|eukprot:RNF08483.1 hypothetical protein TraAM80_02708 [Trypanosoma rangeli]
MRERREGREPHTFLDNCCLEEQVSPRLNELRHQNCLGENPEATSTVFNCFSSVSSQQPGISYDSAYRSRNGVGYFPPPPPPPFPPLPFFVGDDSGTDSKFVGWPPPLPTTHWTLPQDAPWIPPPPIPPNASGVSRNNMGGSAATKWPTPQDIPLPSTFPFPPYLLPPFAPMPSNADWGQMPPPPPWFPCPQGDQHHQQRGQYSADDTSTLDDADDDDANDGTLTEPGSRRGGGPGSHRKSSARQPSMSMHDEKHMSLMVREAERRQLQTKGVRSSTRNSLRNATKDGRQVCENSSSVQGWNAPRAAAASARRFSSPAVTSRPVKTTSRPSSRPIPLDRRRNDYMDARALKGVSPRLEDAMKGRPYSRNVRVSNASRGRGRPHTHNMGVGGKSNSIRHLSDISVPRGVRHASYQEAAKQDERVAEYLKGIEDLYKRLRSSYEDFQRDPSKYLKNVSILKEAAVAKAPPPPQSSSFSPAVSRPSLAPHDFLDDTAAAEDKGYDIKRVAPQEKGVPPLSRESQRIREELFKLEMQWQRLEELKRGTTGECGAAPMEMLQDDFRETTSRMLHGTRAGRAEFSVGKPQGHENGRLNERVTSMRDSLYGGSVQGIAPVEGVRKDKPKAGILSRSSTSHLTGDEAQNSFLDGGQVGHENRSANTSTSSHRPFTRDHVLELVRERKAMLE